MCGICGEFDIAGKTLIQQTTIKRMCDAIVHRGPDDYGIRIDRHVGMGMRRLSIIDVAGGHQPLSNEDGTVWIVFNGEIYNFQQLRQDLLERGHKFRTRTDTETIVHLYEEYGVQCLEHLRGMFAFMIWDSRRERVFVARDRLGIKPCFWSQKGSSVAVASEMKSLLTLPWLDDEMDWSGFDAFFTYTYIPAPLTIYKNIKKLPPAHYLIAENGRIEVHRYWNLSFADKLRPNEEKIQEEFISLLQESVDIRLMSEVPLGAFLSGGIDSGLIVALMSRERQGHNTFTVSFGGSKGAFLDERPYAVMIAQRYASSHVELEVAPAIEQAMSATVDAFDEPFADDGCIPTYHICDAAKKDVTVILTGLGGDENFAGYERYLGFWLSRFAGLLPRWFWSGCASPLVGLLREQKSGHYRINHLKRFVAGAALSPAERYQSFIRTMSSGERRELYHPDVAAQVDFEYVDWLGRVHFEQLEEGDALDRALYQDICMYLPDDILALSDRIGMHHSLELRVPFVDHKLVEFCARIPSSLKLHRGEKKYVLKKAAHPLLPESVIAHRKQGFCAPMASWLAGDLRKVVTTELSDSRIHSQGLFNGGTVQQKIGEHYTRAKLHDKLLFSLLIFNKWRSV